MKLYKWIKKLYKKYFYGFPLVNYYKDFIITDAIEKSQQWNGKYYIEFGNKYGFTCIHPFCISPLQLNKNRIFIRDKNFQSNRKKILYYKIYEIVELLNLSTYPAYIGKGIVKHNEDGVFEIVKSEVKFGVLHATI